MPVDDHYKAFLVRFTRRGENLPWRATLVNVDTSESCHFATEQEALVYLLRTLANPTFTLPEPE